MAIELTESEMTAYKGRSLDFWAKHPKEGKAYLASEAICDLVNYLPLAIMVYMPFWGEETLISFTVNMFFSLFAMIAEDSGGQMPNPDIPNYIILGIYALVGIAIAIKAIALLTLLSKKARDKHMFKVYRKATEERAPFHIKTMKMFLLRYIPGLIISLVGIVFFVFWAIPALSSLGDFFSLGEITIWALAVTEVLSSVGFLLMMWRQIACINIKKAMDDEALAKVQADLRKEMEHE